jgi:CRISPR/Cas system endoribonuclease Cas6 (RAMP superfamily)
MRAQSVVLTVGNGGDGWWRRPDALRALAYAVFDRVEPELSRHLHALSGSRPFTLATLERAGYPRSGWGLGIRLTGLDAVASDALVVGGVSLQGGGRLAFGRSETQILHCSLEAPPLADRATYAELAQLPFMTHAELEFVTPTAFSQGGDLHLPLPVPDLLLRSWARRWNEYALPDLQFADPLLAAVGARVAVAEARLETRTVSLGVGKLVGFTGRVVLEALRPRSWSVEESRVFASLTAYSRFCGTGVRTTQGLGLTLPAHRGAG